MILIFENAKQTKIKILKINKSNQKMRGISILRQVENSNSSMNTKIKTLIFYNK